ncbi:MAG: hypothetical protein KatS3mg024_0590 [Armatimonadota bacterium]|nr:MAG: hypothetical protein KatS3mg024_0590 [Armatimonadota bacterium]
MVATRSGGPEEIIRDGETGLLVDVEQPDQMADAILRLLEDVALRDRILVAARQQVESRFCGQEARNVTQLYHTLVGR